MVSLIRTHDVRTSDVIVVSTTDFEVYHGAVNELRKRGAKFTTLEPGDQLPSSTAVVLTDAAHVKSFGGVPTVVVDPDDPREAVDRALATLRGDDGRTIVGIDPGRKPGIAVLSGETVVAAFQVPLTDATDVIRREIADATDPIVRVGHGSRLDGATLVNDLEGVRIELVDETGTTPFLGTGTRGMGDVLAAVNIARRSGEVIDRREVDPTDGELQRIKDRSRRASETNRSIDERLARRVATGELTIDEALSEHRTSTDDSAADDSAADDSAADDSAADDSAADDGVTN